MSEQIENEETRTGLEGTAPVDATGETIPVDTAGEGAATNGANGAVALEPSVVNRAMWRHLITLQWSWNYERMQALGYLYSMLPVIDAVYKTKEERIAAMKRHLVFYNTNPQVGSPPIFGATVALEAQREGEVVDSLKVGLMGPLAGIGDTIQAILYRPIVAVIAASLALAGSVLGPIIMFLSGILWTVLMIPLFRLGYRQGVNVTREVTEGGVLSRITDMATTMGMIVIGGFIPSIMSSVKTPLTYAQTVTVNGQTHTETVALQSVLDKIVPYILPVAFVALAYWLMRGLKLSAVWTLIILAVLAFVLSLIGFL
jgi:mannose/fructose/N-acetylgalactosamine-specific phosphotransferase system component IID